jgi:hypothetical protein
MNSDFMARARKLFRCMLLIGFGLLSFWVSHQLRLHAFQLMDEGVGGSEFGVAAPRAEKRAVDGSPRHERRKGYFDDLIEEDKKNGVIKKEDDEPSMAKWFGEHPSQVAERPENAALLALAQDLKLYALCLKGIGALLILCGVVPLLWIVLRRHKQPEQPPPEVLSLDDCEVIP